MSSMIRYGRWALGTTVLLTLACGPEAVEVDAGGSTDAGEERDGATVGDAGPEYAVCSPYEE